MRSTSAAILERLIVPGGKTLSPEAARSLLQLSFPASDQDRVAELSTKAQEGRLGSEERAELEDYLRVADLLAMLQSKARLSLKASGIAPGRR